MEIVLTAKALVQDVTSLVAEIVLLTAPSHQVAQAVSLLVHLHPHPHLQVARSALRHVALVAVAAMAVALVVEVTVAVAVSAVVSAAAAVTAVVEASEVVAAMAAAVTSVDTDKIRI